MRSHTPPEPLPVPAITATAFLVTMMGTTLPTPLYPIYAVDLAFSDLTVTVLFAVYAFGVVATLAVFGRLSDDLGRRPVLLLAVALAALSAVVFLLPSTLPLLILGRVLSGLSAGLMSGTGTAAVIDLFGPHHKAAGGVLALAANTGGLALGPLVAGVLADLLPAPLILPFLLHLLLTLLAGAGLLILVPAATRRPDWRIHWRRLRVPAVIRGAFVKAELAAGTAFAVTGVLTAVTALFLSQYLKTTNHFLPGLVLFSAFASMALGQLLARRIPPWLALPLGCLGLILAAALLAVALGSVTLAVLLVAAVVLGLSGGLCLNAGIATTVGRTEPHLRGDVSSAFFAGLYLMLAVPAVGVGVVTRFTNLRAAGLMFTALVATLAAAVLIADRIGASRRRG